MRHGRTLLATLLGSFVLSIPSWIDPLLSSAHAKKLTELLTVSPHTYRYLAAAVFGAGLMYASFLAWNEERDAIERLSAELAKRDALKEGPLSLFVGPAYAQRKHTFAMERLASEMERQRREYQIEKPKPAVRAEYRNNILSLVVANGGALGEFYGKFGIDGRVRTDNKTDLFCKWANSDSPTTKISKGDSARIELAYLKPHDEFHTWQMYTTTEAGQPTTIEADQSSCSVSGPSPEEAGDIIIEGRIVSEPDAVNGVQRFKYVLRAFGPDLRNLA
jgi:hypothetical protein